MADISVYYAGLKLKNPLIAGSSGLTNHVENIRSLEKAGASAVILKSLFEEQIMYETDQLISPDETGVYYPDAEDHITSYSSTHTLADYLGFIRECKQAVSIPVIASINCISAAGWTSFAKEIEQAGADALELNIFLLPVEIESERFRTEQIYIDIIKAVRKEVRIPVTIKIGNYFTTFARTMVELSWSGISGIVLFNRFFSPDIDIERMEPGFSGIFSNENEYLTSLRWIALLSGKVYCDLSASTGIHSGETVIKQLLAGAKAVQITSVLYKKGFEQIGIMLSEIEAWMNRHNINNLKDITGKMNYAKISDPGSYLRVQFMKHVAGIE